MGVVSLGCVGGTSFIVGGCLDGVLVIAGGALYVVDFAGGVPYSGAGGASYVEEGLDGGFASYVDGSGGASYLKGDFAGGASYPGGESGSLEVIFSWFFFELRSACCSVELRGGGG